MNVNIQYWSQLFSLDEVSDVHGNFLAGTFLLRRIIDRCADPTVRSVATLYNGLGFEHVQDYGARVAQILQDFSSRY